MQFKKTPRPQICGWAAELDGAFFSAIFALPQTSKAQKTSKNTRPLFCSSAKEPPPPSRQVTSAKPLVAGRVPRMDHPSTSQPLGPKSQRAGDYAHVNVPFS